MARRRVVCLVIPVHVLFALFRGGMVTESASLVGYDAFEKWADWHRLRSMGVRAEVLSTYDRTGGNLAADSAHFLYQTSLNRSVVLDIDGEAAGAILFARFQH